MTEPLRVKRGDVGVVFADVFANAEGTPIPLSGASVLFIMASDDDRIVGTADVVGDGSTGAVTYEVVEGDLDVAGRFRQEWEATFDDGRVLTSPGSTWNGVEVVEDLNPPVSSS